MSTCIIAVTGRAHCQRQVAFFCVSRHFVMRKPSQPTYKKKRHGKHGSYSLNDNQIF